jgi:cation diffusion facilitator family transporter
VSVQLVALLTNIGLAVLKFAVGTVAGSRALIADGFNSAGDVFATFVAWVAFRIGRAPPDEDHHYGHANAEALAGLLIGGMLCATGAFITLDSAVAWFNQSARTAPGAAAAWAAAVTMLVKEVLCRVSLRVGGRTGSPTLLASARDHRADVITSGVALLGVLAARHGWVRFDDIAGTAIGGYILALGIAPVKSNVRILMAGAPVDLGPRAASAAVDVPGVAAVAEAKVLPMGGRYQVDMTIRVEGSLSVTTGHAIAHAAEGAVMAAMPEVTAVRVHVEPAEA